MHAMVELADFPGSLMTFCCGVIWKLKGQKNWALPSANGAVQTPTPSGIKNSMRPFLTLHSPAQTRAFYDAGLWTADTFYRLLEDHAASRPVSYALRDGHERVTWQELRQRVDALAADLHDVGLVAGDRVSLWLSNRIDAVVMFLACTRQGIACNPSLHRTHTCADITALLTRLNAAAFLTEPEWGADRKACDFEAMLENISTLKKVYSLDAMPKPDLVERAEGDAKIETYTVMHRPDGPEHGLIIGRLTETGQRFLANTPQDQTILMDLQENGDVGRGGSVRHVDGKNWFVPT